MPTISRPDGATIYYEVHGSGYPLLLIAPGGVSSQVEFWRRGAINPITAFASDFQVIAMDQRFAGRSPAPAGAFSYDDCIADQLAVLDAVGVPRAHVMGGCIGCAHIWRLIATAPERVTAAVAQDPVGLDHTNSLGTFYAMFNETMRVARAEGVASVVAAAQRDPLFVTNNAAGPFSARLATDEAFRDEVRKMTVESYVALVIRFRDGMWPPNPPYFTVSEEWMKACPAPVLVLPGRDPFHPTSIAEQVCRDAPKGRCLPVDCREPANVAATVEEIRAFLKANTPA
ncbi:MAG: alpha/beta fold hydrolase [Dehalococcoidia bacterium]